jgi:hypothetical protein
MKKRPRILTIHHQACTGGTLICKCLAVMPRTMLLSEVHPLNLQPMDFNPFDPVAQFQLQTYQGFGFTGEELGRIFVQRVGLVYEQCRAHGYELVLRDHSHTDYMYPQVDRGRPLLHFLQDKYEPVSIVTLRNPVETWLALENLGWHKCVQGFDDYCSRLLMFLEDYKGLPVFHYEEFLAAPVDTMRRITAALGLPLDPEFMGKFSQITLTGDSGRARSSDRIERLPMREFSESFRQTVLNSEPYRRLAALYGYALDPAELAARIREELPRQRA